MKEPPYADRVFYVVGVELAVFIYLCLKYPSLGKGEWGKTPFCAAMGCGYAR